MTKTTMTADDIERMYEALARGIDAAGPTNEALFLAKLVLMLGNDLGDADRFEALAQASLQHVDAGLSQPEKPRHTSGSSLRSE